MLYGTEPGLFRAVIADSSAGPLYVNFKETTVIRSLINPISKNAPYAWQYDKAGLPYSRLLAATGCAAGPGSVECLRQVPYEVQFSPRSGIGGRG